jgi:hypothetical protein
MMMYRGTSSSVPGNICETRKDIIPVRRPGNRNREKAYAAVQARNTPTTVVDSATMALLKIQRRNGCSVSTSVKLLSDHWLGQGMTARNRSRNDGSDGTSAKARFWVPEKATLMTHRTG